MAKVQDELLEEYDHIIINSGFFFPKEEYLTGRVSMIDEMLRSGKATYLLGRQDYMLWSDLDPHDENAKWIIQQPNVANVEFENGYQFTVMDGGVPKGIKEASELQDNQEASFLVNWHESYDGALGFVISNKPLTTTKPKMHRFSMQIGTLPSCPTYAIEMGQYGLNRIISL